MKKGIFIPWEQLLKECLSDRKQTTVCEIGTHRGKTAEQICKYLLENCWGKVHYIGYDAFDLANEKTDLAEVNGKGPGDEVYANHLLKRLMKYPVKRFTYELIKGWTQDTLKEGKYDFVYIDGGHSYESVKHDHTKLEQSTITVFDDYQIPSVAKYFDEYVSKHKIKEVPWNFDIIKNRTETVFAFMPHKTRKNKEFVLGEPTGHIQPVIFRK